jgi:hypothetical protein
VLFGAVWLRSAAECAQITQDEGIDPFALLFNGHSVTEGSLIWTLAFACTPGSCESNIEFMLQFFHMLFLS